MATEFTAFRCERMNGGSGQLPTTGGAPEVGAALDVDDATRKAHQDWSQSGAPLPAGGFPEGGGGGAARVVPRHFDRH